MKKAISKIKFVYFYIVNSIGFYPTVISLLFFFFALLMVYLETRGLSERLHEDMPFLIIKSGEAANTILSSVVTGVISLTVFSFTMVMLVLNQAGSNFSPRVIPGLISQQSNQKIVGLYLGTLIYALVIMVNIRSDSYYEELPGLAVFLAMAFMILCLGFFVYFIHAISQSIQIDNILESIHRITKKNLEKLIQKDKHLKLPKIFQEADFIELNSPRSGYVQSIDIEPVLALCKKHGIVMEFTQPMGNYLIKETPFIRISKPVKDSKKLCEEVAGYLNFKQEELASVNYLYGFKQITESAVKALSPSINDPGTAVKAIDYLTDLFYLRMELTDEQLMADEEGVVRIRFDQETFDCLYALCLTSLRMYGKGDTLVIMRLLYMLKNLLYRVGEFPSRKGILYREALLLVHAVDKSIDNPGDREMINTHLRGVNSMGILERDLPLLTMFD